MLLSDQEWEKINRILLMIYQEEDLKQIRYLFLKMLRQLVVFNIAEFSLGNGNNRFYDSVEINMASDKTVHFLDRYLDYLDKYGNVNMDWVFRNSSSIVVRAEDVVGEGIFEETNFNKIYLKSINMKHCCTCSISHQGEYLGEYSLYLADGYGDFTYRDLYILEQLKEHLEIRLLIDKQRKIPIKLTEEQYKNLLQMNMTDREIDVFNLVMQGKTNEQIAGELFISIFTVKKHLCNIFEKLNIESRNKIKIYFTK